MGAPKAVSSTIVSILVLTVLLVGGGLAYTYFLGPDGGQAVTSSAPATTAAPDQPAKLPKMAENAKESAAIQSLTSPVTPGSNVSLTARTNPGSKCTISVIYNNVASTDSGLAPKVADDYGIVSWSWTVGSSVPLGKWPVKVTCIYNTRSAVVQGDLVVVKTLENPAQ